MNHHGSNSLANAINRDFSYFILPSESHFDDRLPFEDDHPHRGGASNNGSQTLFDRDYLWEGDDMMYEDIVASTQPLNYNPAYLRKFDYFQNHHWR